MIVDVAVVEGFDHVVVVEEESEILVIDILSMEEIELLDLMLMNYALCSTAVSLNNFSRESTPNCRTIWLSLLWESIKAVCITMYVSLV